MGSALSKQNIRRSHLPILWEWLAVALARCLYRVRFRGLENLPQGGAVIVANHLSYMDVVAIQLAFPRPLRFMAYAGPGTGPLMNWIFRKTKIIPVIPGQPVSAVRRAVCAVKAGEWLCIFPEGGMSRTGQLMRIRNGFDTIAQRADVPVVPVAIDGLWDSIFSFSGGRYLWKKPKLRRLSVFVAIGRPQAGSEADPASVRQALLELGAEAFSERPALKGHLGRETLKALARSPGRIAVVDRTMERRTLTAAQLIAAAAILSRRLKRTVRERRIGIVLPPGIGAVVANLAVVWAGKVPVNINFTASRESIQSSMERSGVTLILSASAMRERIAHFPWLERTVDIRDEITASGGKLAMLPWFGLAWVLPGSWIAALLGIPALGDDSEAALLFTSGSGGDPRGVILTHRNILANCGQVSSMSILPRDCTMLGCLPIFHSFGFTVTLWYPLLRSRGLVTVPSPLDTRKILDALFEEEATVIVGAPTFLRPILKKARPGDLRFLHFIVAGAERLPDDLHRAFRERFHIEVLQGYGMTEAAPVASVNQLDPPVTTGTADPQAGNHVGTVGRLLPGIAARIVHPETSEALPATSSGLICLKGANLFTGYLDGDPGTRDGWYSTGDLGQFDLDGFLTIAGRLSRFSKIGAEMVSHAAIEQSLLEVLGLDQSEGPCFAVVGVPDAAKGEVLILVSTVNLTVEEMRSKLTAAGLPNLWIPKMIVKMEKLPLLGTGKLDLAALRRAALAARD